MTTASPMVSAKTIDAMLDKMSELIRERDAARALVARLRDQVAELSEALADSPSSSRILPHPMTPVRDPVRAFTVAILEQSIDPPPPGKESFFE